MPKRKLTRAAVAAEASPQKKSRRVSSPTSKKSSTSSNTKKDVNKSKRSNTNHEKSISSSISSSNNSTSYNSSGSRTFHFTKKVGQRLEICDKDNIWSAAKVIKIHTKQKKITITYTGWENHWNENISYVNNPRLADFETHTKRYKCLVDLFPKGRNTTSAIKFDVIASSMCTDTTTSTRHKNKNNGESATKNKSSKKTSTLWPCIVHIRTPNPLLTSLSDYKAAEQFLQTEPNVFIQPYGMRKNCLPKHLVAKSIDNGKWVKTTRIRKWRDDMNYIEGVPPLNFDLAHVMAKEDNDVEEFLTFHPFETGSLVYAEYRETPQGYEEGMDESDEEEEDDYEEEEEDGDDIEDDDQSSSRSSSKEKESKESNASKESMKSNMSILKGKLPTITNDLIYEPPPTLPQPIKVNTSIYPDYNIVKSTKTGKWIASFLRNGNDVYIGSFVTQTEARDAIVEAINAESVSKEKKTNNSTNAASASTTIVDALSAKSAKPESKTKSSSSLIKTTTTITTTTTTTATVETNDKNNHHKSITQNNELKEEKNPPPQKVNMELSYKEQDMKALSLSAVISLEPQQQSQQQKQQQQQQQPKEDFSLHEWTMQNTKHKGYLKEKDERYRLKFEELKRKRINERKIQEAKMMSTMQRGKDQVHSFKKHWSVLRKENNI